MEQEIIIDPIPDIKRVVDEPWLPLGTTTSGVSINFTVTTGTDVVEIVEGPQINVLGTGAVVITATAPAHNGYDEATLDLSFNVLEPTTFEMMESISRRNANLIADMQQLAALSKTSTTDILNLNYDLTDLDVGKVLVNDQEYVVKNRWILQKHINMTIAFWAAEITKEFERLAAHKALLKEAL